MCIRDRYLRARVDGREQDCLLDTGSQISVLPSSIVPKEYIRPADYTLKAVNGTKIEVLGQATLPLITPWCMTTVTGLVTDHVAEVLLGADWSKASCLLSFSVGWKLVS